MKGGGKRKRKQDGLCQGTVGHGQLRQRRRRKVYVYTYVRRRKGEGGGFEGDMCDGGEGRRQEEERKKRKILKGTQNNPLYSVF